MQFVNAQCVAKNGGEHHACQCHIMTMPVCSYWGDGNVVGYARREWWSDVAVERGDDGY